MRNNYKIITAEENNGCSLKSEPGKIYVDFSRIVQKIKPLHGICNSHRTFGEPLPEILEAGIPYTRLHDTFGKYGGNTVVDIKLYSKVIIPPKVDETPQNITKVDKYLLNLLISKAIVHIINVIETFITIAHTKFISAKNSKVPYRPPTKDAIKILTL